METYVGFVIIAVAALIHTSFQLSVSVLTLLSGHAIGKKTAHGRLLRLTSSFVLGTVVATLLLLSTIVYVVSVLLPSITVPPVLWAVSAGLMLGLGVAVWALYYRKEPAGTTLWLPRSFARFLSDRAKATKLSAEAFGLGLTSTMAEIVFLCAPLLVAALAVLSLPVNLQLLGTAVYVIVSSLALLTVWVLIGGGHKLSRIQQWREANKTFLRAAAGSGLLLLGLYVYVEHVVGIAVITQGSI